MFETKRLFIREYTQKDEEQLHQILSDPTTMKFWPAPFSLEQTKNWITRRKADYQERGFGRWALIDKETGELIGDCGIIVLEIDGQWENDLGYIIHHPYWQQGYGFEAANACKDYAFTSLGLTRLCANMAFDHVGSQRVAERIGMKKEKEFFNKKNRDILTYVYSI